ncbi:MAG: hypothetical protein K6G92_08160 [Bacteroidaceae bacterium]|nr:hypothetical protein [Bacteroidaceae bacterium]
MKKTTILVILALIGAVSKAEGQVNPKISQLFEELKQTKGVMYPKTPTIIKRGGMDNSGNHPQLDYSLHLYYRPDLIRGRQDSHFVDSVLRIEKACFDKRVKAIRRTVSEMQKEAQDSCHYESHTGGKDTIVCSLNLCRDTTRVHKYSDDKFSYFYSDEFLYFVLESGKAEESFEGLFHYCVSLPGLDLYSGTYSWGDMNDDIESLMNEHGISHRNAFWQHDDAYSHAVWDDEEEEERSAWINIVNYGEYAYAGVTEAKIYSLTEDQKPLAQQLLAAIDSMALRFTNSWQDRYYEYHYGASFKGNPSTILAVYTRQISETNSIQVRVADHSYHFLILYTRGTEWLPTEWFCLKSFINGKKEYFEGMKPRE